MQDMRDLSNEMKQFLFPLSSISIKKNGKGKRAAPTPNKWDKGRKIIVYLLQTTSLIYLNSDVIPNWKKGNKTLLSLTF
jgi:hypothetical protein